MVSKAPRRSRVRVAAPTYPRVDEDDPGCAPTGKASDSDTLRFRLTVECAPVGIAHVRPDGRWLWVNDCLCSLIGYSREELLCRTFQDITHPDDLAADLAQVQEALGGERATYAMDKRYLRKDGAVVWARLTVTLVRDAEGRPEYFIAIIEDITERKRLEEEHAHLWSVVGHEISTPLTSLKARAQLLRRQLAGQHVVAEATQAHLAGIERAVSQLERQALDLRVAARADQGSFTLELTRCDLVALCAQAVEAEQLAEDGREIRLEAPAAPIYVDADADRLGQVLTNLLTNAVKYSPADRPVTVSVGHTGDLATVAVLDEGTGIPAEAIPRLFGRFYRVPGIEARGGGGASLGLGLYIARTIVERHAGTLTVESSPGVGSTFRVTLPRAAEGEWPDRDDGGS